MKSLEQKDISEFEAGVLIGLLMGEGHFGGDGRQAQITLRMHTRHEQLFRWLESLHPESKLYGPYHHSGRSYYQWMVRGEVLKKWLIPILDGLPLAELDSYAYERYQQMKERYGL